jgi:hypothetical protein
MPESIAMGPISSMDQFVAAGVISGGSVGAGHSVNMGPSDDPGVRIDRSQEAIGLKESW